MCPRPFTHPHVSLIFSVGSVVLWSWVCEGTSALRRLALCRVSKAPYSGFALACGFFRGVRRSVLTPGCPPTFRSWISGPLHSKITSYKTGSYEQVSGFADH